MAKQMARALTNIGWNPEFFPEKPPLEMLATAGDVFELPAFYLDRPDLVKIWVSVGAIELVEPPKVYVPKIKESKDGE